jgi:formamidase
VHELARPVVSRCYSRPPPRRCELIATRVLDRYAVIAIQTAFGSAHDAEAVHRNLDRAVELIEGAVWAYSQWGAPVRLICLPEFCLQGIPYYSRGELVRNGVLLRSDGPELERLTRVARERDILIHCGTILEGDDAYPGLVFNTAVVVGADGVVLRYRKVNPWIPIETFASPHLVEGYDEELFPVADTHLGHIACLTCYDALFPETYREVASKGAEIVLLANALPNPWQTESPTPWMTIVPQVRSLENAIITVNVNQGGDLAPFQFNGGTAVVDWEGRILAQTLQRGEQFVYARVDLAGLREWRRTTYQHLGPAHLRSDVYTYLSRIGVTGGSVSPDGTVTNAGLRRMIDEGRSRWLGA